MSLMSLNECPASLSWRISLRTLVGIGGTIWWLLVDRSLLSMAMSWPTGPEAPTSNRWESRNSGIVSMAACEQTNKCEDIDRFSSPQLGAYLSRCLNAIKQRFEAQADRFDANKNCEIRRGRVWIERGSNRSETILSQYLFSCLCVKWSFHNRLSVILPNKYV